MNPEEPELWARGSATDAFPARLSPGPAADAGAEEAEPRPMAAGGGLGLLPFLRLLGQLKRVPRTGWVYRNVAEPESVSDHMYRMAMMALVTEDKSLNKDRCIRLALVHDMAECIVGDIAPADNIPKEEKHRREETAMQQLTHLLSEDLRREIYELWEEYENQSSAEAKFVKQLDQCEMILQAFEYEELEKTPGRLQDFFDSTAGKFVHPEILQLVSLINTEREKRIADASHPHS
ncbi:5'-deoxynucleotidase HDDC2 isoform X1 [Lonchura striata]|uniref:5'-deoxynucleotidase HDDC2 n=1 Tax=Lonchura striata TaxID=40157 RepID=A0A218V3W4_9PASE|nr:HD domain-containing protein 2 isoform X1 [Lonchura striata domestica]OWK60765.1 HD domain-containing protein 2 [Lonchura striata domestica]